MYHRKYFLFGVNMTPLDRFHFSEHFHISFLFFGVVVYFLCIFELDSKINWCLKPGYNFVAATRTRGCPLSVTAKRPGATSAAPWLEGPRSGLTVVSARTGSAMPHGGDDASRR